jgi:hypothetical protein
VRAALVKQLVKLSRNVSAVLYPTWVMICGGIADRRKDSACADEY